MFSSGSRTREGGQNYPTQWALNPSAYQNISSEHVDWAALAQQWIMMKESAPPEHPPSGAAKKDNLNEGGEAPMDVDNEKEDGDCQWSDSGAVPPVQDSWNWQQQWGNWSNNWNGPPPTGVVPPAVNTSSVSKTALLPTPFSHYAPPGTDSNSVPTSDYQRYLFISAYAGCMADNIFVSSYEGSGSTAGSDYSGSTGYWTNSGSTARGKHPTKPGRLSRKGLSTDSRPEPVAEPVTLDAARRRQLPAWIREGKLN